MNLDKIIAEEGVKDMVGEGGREGEIYGGLKICWRGREKERDMEG